MAGPVFKGDYVILTDRWDRQLRLYRTTWALKLAHKERWFLVHNYEKLIEAMKDPDQVIESKSDVSRCLYYKHFTEYRLNDAGTRSLTTSRFWVCVVASPSKRRVLTFYPAESIKGGKVLYDKAKGIDLLR